jgi:hypothetical protein
LASCDVTLPSAHGVCLVACAVTFGYVSALRSFLVLWLITLPFVLVGEYGLVAAPAIAFIAFLFLVLEQMAIEIEQPFGDDANDLPMEMYILDLERTLCQMLPGAEQEVDESDDDKEEEEEKEDAGGEPDVGGRPHRGGTQQPPTTNYHIRADRHPAASHVAAAPSRTANAATNALSMGSRSFFPPSDPLSDPLKGWRPGARPGSRLGSPALPLAVPTVHDDVLAQLNERGAKAASATTSDADDAHGGPLGA